MGDRLLWGDEIEYVVVSLDHETKEAKLSLRQSEILAELQEEQAKSAGKLDDMGCVRSVLSLKGAIADAKTQHRDADVSSRVRAVHARIDTRRAVRSVSTGLALCRSEHALQVRCSASCVSPMHSCHTRRQTTAGESEAQGSRASDHLYLFPAARSGRLPRPASRAGRTC